MDHRKKILRLGAAAVALAITPVLRKALKK